MFLKLAKVFAWKDIWRISSNICRSSFISLYCILTKLCPFLSLLIYLLLILDNMSGPLYKFYTNRRIFFKLLKCSPQLGNVQNSSYPCTSFVKDIGGGMKLSLKSYLMLYNIKLVLFVDIHTQDIWQILHRGFDMNSLALIFS